MSAVFDTVDGTIRVVNDGTGMWNSDASPSDARTAGSAPDTAEYASSAGQWTIQEVWRIGGAAAEGPEVFGSPPLSLSLGPNAQVFILDPQNGNIRVFDDDGRFVRQFGTRGEGPGEFLLPLAIEWDSRNRLWVPDLIGRYTLFDSLGMVLETFTRPSGSVIQRAGAARFDENGRLIDHMGTGSANAGSASVAFFRVDPTGAIVDTLSAIPLPIVDRNPIPLPPGVEGVRAGTPSTAALSHFRPRLVFAAAPDGSIWFAESNAYRLMQRTPEGEILRIVENQRPIPSPTADEQTLINASVAAMGRDPSDFAYGRQLIQRIHVLDDGHLLVQIEEEPGRASSLFDVFDPTGRYLGPLRFGFPVDPASSVASREDTLVVVTTDELDVASVVLLTIDRPRL